MADDDFDIDIYGDTNEEPEKPKKEEVTAVKVEEATAINNQANADDENLGNDEEEDYADISVDNKEVKPELSDGQQQIKSTDESSHDVLSIPKQAPQQQGVKRKEGSDERAIDPGATTAIMISELHWWNTDDDVRGWINQAQCEDELKEITFSEHKVNGKSKGQAYVEFTSQQAATAAKHKIDAFGEGQQYVKKHTVAYSNPNINPFKTLPKDAPAKFGKDGPANRSTPGGYEPRGAGNFGGNNNNFRGRGGFNANRGNMNNMGGGFNRNFSGQGMNNRGGFQGQMGGFQGNNNMGGNFGGFNGGMRGGAGGMRGGRGGMMNNMGNPMMGMPMGGMPMGGMGNMSVMGGPMGMGNMGGGMPGTVTPEQYRLYISLYSETRDRSQALSEEMMRSVLHSGQSQGHGAKQMRREQPPLETQGLHELSPNPFPGSTTFHGRMPIDNSPYRKMNAKQSPQHTGAGFQGMQPHFNPAFFQQQNQAGGNDWQNPHGAKRPRPE